jgi:hypothetical protein
MISVLNSLKHYVKKMQFMSYHKSLLLFLSPEGFFNMVKTKDK